MICYNCGNDVTIKHDVCDYCGEDLSILQRAYKLSNSYYNMGLSKAKVRDLTGAVFILKKSLEINKRNTDARNLLGLIYFEMGEIVAALSEWVIGKHLDPDNKTSNYYIDSVQSNPNQLDTLNQAIKKYNTALDMANQGNDDVAIMQLRQGVSLYPNFIKALQLLSLLYINNKEYDKALKYLRQAKKIDVSNTRTLKYLQEIEEFIPAIKANAKKQSKIEQQEAKQQAQFTPSSYKEDKPNVGLFISLIAGIVIGVVASVILIMPTVRDQAVSQFRDSEVEYNARINEQDQELSSIQKENDDLKEQLGQLETDVTEAQDELDSGEGTAYENLMSATYLYLDGLTNNDLNSAEIAEELAKVNIEGLEGDNAINLYNTIKDDVYIEASEELYTEGHDLYSSGDYEEAVNTLLKAYEYNPEDVNAIYFIGRSYHQLENYEKAREYYNILTEDYPATDRASEARSRLQEIE